MNSLTTAAPTLPAMSPQAVDMVRRLEDELIGMPQVDIETKHTFHAGMYARTITIPAGVVLTGALIKLPTIVIVEGDCTVFVGGDQPSRLVGYHVLQAAAGRKQVFMAHRNTHVTMMFPSAAQTVEDAENEFTDEAHRLLSRRTHQEKEPCQEP